MEIQRESRRIRELNLVPLVDVILILVIFFMISTSFVASESMELSLPSGNADDASSGSTKATRILIQPSGDVLVNNMRMDDNGLNAHLAQVLANDGDEKIAIFTTPGVSVQQLVRVMDTVYLTGGRNVQVDKIETPVGEGA